MSDIYLGYNFIIRNFQEIDLIFPIISVYNTVAIKIFSIGFFFSVVRAKVAKVYRKSLRSFVNTVTAVGFWFAIHAIFFGRIVYYEFTHH